MRGAAAEQACQLLEHEKGEDGYYGCCCGDAKQYSERAREAASGIPKRVKAVCPVDSSSNDQKNAAQNAEYTAKNNLKFSASFSQNAEYTAKNNLKFSASFSGRILCFRHIINPMLVYFATPFYQILFTVYSPDRKKPHIGM